MRNAGGARASHTLPVAFEPDDRDRNGDDARRRAALWADVADDFRDTARRTGLAEPSPRVWQALRAVPRDRFVAEAWRGHAWENRPLPIGAGQTISQPFIVALMTALADPEPQHRVLEVGTGCGYQCALLAQLADSVVSIERVRDLFDKARAQLAPLRVDRVRLVHGDGMRGHAPNAPYHSIIAAAVGDEPAPAWLEQLAIGGRLIAPVRSGKQQVLAVIDRELHGYRRLDLEPVHFVPLKSGVD